MDTAELQQTVDLRDYIRILNKRKALLIFPLLVTVLTVFAGSYFIEPAYESSTTVLVAETSLLSPTFSRLVPGEDRRYTRDQRQERLNTIRNQIVSSSYLAQLIRRLKVSISDDTKKTVTALHRQFPEISELELARKIQIEKIREKVSVSFKGSNLIQITIEANTPVMATDMARTLAQIYIDESLASELVGVKGAMDFSDEMLTVYRERLRQSEDALRRFEQKQLKRSVEQDSSITENLNEINSAIDATDLEMAAVSKEVDNVYSDLQNRGIKNPTIEYSNSLNNHKFEILGGIGELTELLAKYSWRDAKVIRLNEQARQRLEAVESEVETLTAEQFPELNLYDRQKISDREFLIIKLSFLREKRTVLDRAVDKIKNVVALNPTQQQRHNELLRTVDENRRIYELFSEQLTGSQISQAATRAEAETKYKIIEPAAIPTSPVKPNRVKLAGMGAILGFALGIGAILLIEFLDNSFRKVEEVESYLGLSVIGTIPRLDLPFSQKNPGRVWVYLGTAVTIFLVGFVIFLSRQN